MSTPTAATAKLAKLTDAELIDERRKLDARTDLEPAERMVAAWVADELHRRYPETEAILDRYFELDENLDRSYGDLLADALEEVTGR